MDSLDDSKSIELKTFNGETKPEVSSQETSPTPLQASPQRAPEVPFQPSEGMKVTPCSYCRLNLQHPQSAYFVQCPSCKAMTAARALNSMHCCFCRRLVYYPAEASFVRCSCGSTFNIMSQAPNNN